MPCCRMPLSWKWCGWVCVIVRWKSPLRWKSYAKPMAVTCLRDGLYKVRMDGEDAITSRRQTFRDPPFGVPFGNRLPTVHRERGVAIGGF